MSAIVAESLLECSMFRIIGTCRIVLGLPNGSHTLIVGKIQFVMFAHLNTPKSGRTKPDSAVIANMPTSTTIIQFIVLGFTVVFGLVMVVM